jgi:hypothetical protein
MTAGETHPVHVRRLRFPGDGVDLHTLAGGLHHRLHGFVEQRVVQKGDPEVVEQILDAPARTHLGVRTASLPPHLTSQGDV